MKNLATRTLLTLVFASTAALGAELTDTEAIDEYLDQAVANTKIPGLVALVVDADSTLYSRAVGLRNVARNEAMTEDTIFRIASMTKPVATTGIMMLVEDGKLGLDDPIAQYIPEFAERRVVTAFDPEHSNWSTRPASIEATIRHLISHSSGLSYGFASEIIHAIGEGFPGQSEETPLLYDPGTGWSYSGGIAVVGGVAERIEGMGLDTILRDRLFAPLGMHETSFIVPLSEHGRVATTHAPEGDTLVEAQNPNDIRSPVSGDGGLHSTAADYARFIQFILNGGVAPDGQRLMSETGIAELGRNQLGDVRVSLQDEPMPQLARAFPLGADRDGFGLGFQVTGEHDEAGVRSPGSMSWAGIWNTEFWIDPARGIGGVLLMQYMPFYDEAAIATLIGFEQRVYERLD